MWSLNWCLGIFKVAAGNTIILANNIKNIFVCKHGELGGLNIFAKRTMFCSRMRCKQFKRKSILVDTNFKAT